MARKKKNRRTNSNRPNTTSSRPNTNNSIESSQPEIVPLPNQDAAAEIPPFFVWGFSVFLASTALVAPFGQGPYGYNPDLYMATFLQIGSMFSLFIYLLLIFRKKHNEILILGTPLLLPLLLFYLWMVLSLLWAQNFYEGIVKVLDWGAGIIIFIITMMLVRNKHAIFPIVFCLFVSAFLISLLGIGQYLFSVEWVPQHVSPAATFGNKNMNGEYLITTVILGVFLFIRSRQTAASWFYGVATAAGIISLFYGRTRGSWTSFAVELVLTFGILMYFKFGLRYHFSWDIKKIYALAGSFLLAIALMNTTPDFISEDLGLVEKSTGGINKKINPGGGAVSAKSFSEVVNRAFHFKGSKRQRFAMWSNSYAMFEDKFLLGTGIGNWMIYYPLYQEAIQIDPDLKHGTLFHINAHNDYVEFICELGVVGLLLMLWIAVALFRSIIHVFSKHRLSEEYSQQTVDNSLLLAAVVTVILGVASNAFFSFPFQQPVTIALVMAYVGTLAGACFHARGQSAQTFYRIPLSSPISHMPGLVITGVLTIALLALHNKWYDNDTQYFRAMGSNATGKYRTAFQAAQIAYEEFPIRTRVLFYIANYYYRNRQYDKALQVLEKMREDYPYRTEVLSSLAGTYMQLSKTKKFNELIEMWLKAQPSSVTAHYIQAVHAINVGNIDKAIEILEHAQWLRDEYRIHAPEERKVNTLLTKLRKQKASASKTAPESESMPATQPTKAAQ